MDQLTLQSNLPQNSAQRCLKRRKCQINNDSHFKQKHFSGKFFSTLMVTVLFSAFLLMGWTSTAFSQVAKNYQHWADVTVANWNGDILNAQKSDYFEGEVIPHVHVIQGTNKKPLVTGQSYTFTIIYNFYQANTNAGGFAFVTTYNRSRQPGLLPGASGITPILDNTATAGLNIGGSQGYFYTINADVTAATTPVKSGSGTFDNTITVTFTYTGTNPQGMAEFYYGLYVAEPGQVPNQGKGVTDGASSWSGGSLQTTVMSNFSGALSIQLAPSAIIRGEISGLKYSDTNNNGTQNTGEGPLSGWIFYLDTNNNGVPDSGERRDTTGTDGIFSFSVTPDADKSDADNDPYYVREITQSGWTITQPSSGVYGPILVTATDPSETGLLFGNFICVSPEASGVPTNVLCYGESTGSVAVSATGGNSPYTFSRNGVIDADGVFTGLPAGTYTFRATDANGCFDDVQVTITQPAAALVASGVPTDAACFGGSTGSVTVTATGGTSPYTFSRNGVGDSDGVFTGLAAGDYTFTVTDANNCTDDVDVTVGQPTAVTATALADVVCTEGVLTVSLVITPSGGTGPYTITSVPTGVDGSYSYTVTDANDCGCEVSSAANKTSANTTNTTLSTPQTISSTSAVQKSAVVKSSDLALNKLIMTVYPNPFTDEVNFQFKSPTTGFAKLEIFDIMGKSLGVVFKQSVEANTQQVAHFSVPAYSAKAMLVYRLTVNNQAISGKVLPQ